MALLSSSDAELGKLKTLWTNSYNGQKCFFIDHHHVLYKCSSVVKIFNTETGKTIDFIPPYFTNDPSNEENYGNGISLLTANSAISKFAYSETKYPPKIHVHNLDADLSEQSVLTDGASLEYIAIEFSNSHAILGFAGIPDLQVNVWMWETGAKIAAIDVSSFTSLQSVQFSPINWRHIAVATRDELNVWTLEQCGKLTKTHKKRMIMAPIDPDYSETTIALRDEFRYPKHVISALDEEYADAIEEVLDKRERHKLRCSCWTNNNELLVATDENFIFLYSLTNATLRCVYEPSQDSQAHPYEFTEKNSIKSMVVHRHGVFIAGNDGKVRFGVLMKDQTVRLDIQVFDQIAIVKLLDMSTSFVANISPNTTYSSLSIGTDKAIYLLNCVDLFKRDGNFSQETVVASTKVTTTAHETSSLLYPVLSFDHGLSIGIGSLNPFSDHFVVLKDNGCLQIWSNKKGAIVNRVHLGVQCTSLATHSFVQMVAIGTEKGRLIFVDLSEIDKPRIVLNTRLHTKAVKLLKFNSSDTMLITVGEDNKLFVIDTRLMGDSVEQTLLSRDQRLVTSYNQSTVADSKFEKGFYVRGYIEFEGEAVCLDVFDSIVDETINTRVALGLFDKTCWDTIKKTVYDDAPTGQELKSSQSNSANPGSINASMNHNLLVQSVQTKPAVSRYMCVHNVEYVNFDINSTVKTANLACKIKIFDLSLKMFADKEKLYHTKKLDLKDEVISRSSYFTQYLFSDFALSSRNYLVTFTDRFLIKLTIPEYDANKKPSAKLNFLELADIVGSHDFGYGSLSRSLNNQFIVSCGFDGAIVVRKAIDLKTFIETKGNHYKTGGIRAARFQFDSSNILALAQDNTVLTVLWNCTNPEITRLMSLAKMEGEFDRAQLPRLKTQTEIDELKSVKDELSWYEMKEKQFFKDQDEQYSPVIREITTSLKDIKEKLNQLMKANSQREDLAKLKESEFYLDLEELDRLNKESDAEIQKIREKDEHDNLSKIYVREVIKRECWDQMKIKGQGIQAFNSNLLVENYALRERTRDELAQLERCKFVRRIEIAGQKSRPDFVIDPSKKDSLILSLVETDEDDSKDKDQDPGNKDAANQNYLSPNLLHLASKGSIGSLFNGDSNLFYNQFELYTREQKWIQITLIQDAIFRIKENFNREFEQISQRKLQEIGKIREKNQRLKQIYIDLNEEKALSEPELGDQENAELLFEVKDSEIKVEKYLTPEQRKQLEEQLAEEARRRELEKLDNWRERGLMDMMGGVLQIRREDELKKDIPIPPFAKEKAQEEWTPEEVKQYAVYEQKVKDLNEEREKLRKQLLAEINKLNEQITECYSNFDTILLGLHQRKVKTQQAIFQEELKIVRILNSLVVDSELSAYESQMIKKLEKCKQQRKELAQEIQQVKKEIDLVKEDYERTAASIEEKPLDKQFSREFSDVSSGLRDQLLKLLKKRNKPRFNINKTNLNPTHTYLPELGELNPFSERPSTAQQISISEADIQTSLNDLDNFSNAPAGIDQTIWDRFVQFRRQKIAMETSVRMKGLMLSEMQAYMQSRIEEESIKKLETDELTDQTIKLQQLRLQAFHNLEVQYLIKQGQVEINPGPSVHNFENCLLIHRNVVESLNKIIQSHGKQKITIMVNCKNFKKGIRQLDWERKKMSMTIEDYIQKQRDITYLKLSREIQEYLNTEDYEGKKQKEISVLEQTLTYQLKQHEKVYDQKGKRLKEIEKQGVKVANSNDQLDDQLDETNVVLHDRKHLKEEQTGKTIRTIRDERFREIVQRRRLVDLAKAQAQEVAFLRSEVERLRMKTFPALVQIEF